MGIKEQTLPTNEDFAAPDWLAATDGSGDYDAPPFHFHYLALNPSGNLNTGASEYSTFPFRAGGPMEASDTSTLFHPQVDAPGGSMPVQMSDAQDSEYRKLRAFVCREEDTFNYDNLSLEVAFEHDQVSGSTTGSTQQGSGGSSPTPLGRRTIPTTDPSGSTDDENIGILFSPNTNNAGGLGGMDTITPQPAYNGWLGNGLILRAGGGHPAVSSTGSAAYYSVAGVNAYIFVAYPLKNGTDIDLHMEMWRLTFPSSGNAGVPVLLASHVAPDDVKDIDFRRRLRLRVEVDTSGSGNVELKAYIYAMKHGTHYDEHQVFTTGHGWTDSVVAAGPSGDGAVNTSTGVVTDSGTDKIATFADQTFGVIMGRDRLVDVSEFVGGAQLFTSVVEGMHRITVRQADTDTIVYNDRFQRAPQGYPNADATVDEVITGLFNSGTAANGLWLFDGNAENALGSGNSKIRRSLIWTDSTTDTTSPNDYAQTYLDPTPATGDYAAGVARFFCYKRPSTKVYNHHRIVTCVGPDDSTSAEANTWATGVAARGQMTQLAQNSIVFYAYFTSDGSGAQTYLRLAIAHVQGDYDEDVIGQADEIASVVVQAVGAGIPAGYDMLGTSRTLALKAEAYPEGTTPESAAEYTAYFDGSAVTFDTFTQSAYQDGTSKVVFHPAPPAGTTEGREEGFFFYAVNEAQNGSAQANYTLPRWSAWTEGATADDPIFDGDGESQSVNDEGTASVNLSAAIEEVDWSFEVQYDLPRFDITFVSGHRYTSPRFANSRRVITAQATNVSKATMDLIARFHAARKGVEEPFFLDFPVPATETSETLTTITVQFASAAGLDYRRETEDVYSVTLNMIELL
jgi:hypothetical protein